jgi:hypothetical protein
MREIIKTLQHEVDNHNIHEYHMLNYSTKGELVIAGSFDFSYYHNVEIVFEEVKYISCPTSFGTAKFRLATELERERLKPKLDDGWHDLILCIELDPDIDENPIEHYIVAEQIRCRFGVVYHYKRENLEEGEKIAEWVK